MSCQPFPRNYLEHVAHLIESWTREQEAKYQAYLLQWAAEKKAKEIASMKSTDNEGSRPGSGQSKRKGRSSSPTKKSPSMHNFLLFFYIYFLQFLFHFCLYENEFRNI